MKFYAALIVTIVVVLLVSELAPEAINALLILILLGIVLGRYTSFENLINVIVGSMSSAAK